jgi:Fe-S-cluster containining protein
VSSPCSACTKRCCADYTVSVTGYDAWLIATRLRLPLASFLIAFPVNEDNERGFRLEADGARYEIALDKVGAFKRGNPCVFWVDLEDGRGRCGIYAVRPFVCQTYPAYQSGDVVVLRDDVLCPAGSWSLGGMDLPVFRRRLFAFRMEQDIHAYVVARWNRNLRPGAARSVEDFYAHLMNVYGRLERVREAWALGEGRARRFAEAWAGRDAASPNPMFADVGAQEVEGWGEFLARAREAVDPEAVLCAPLAASA